MNTAHAHGARSGPPCRNGGRCRPLPSARLVRAVTAERAELERHRAQLAREADELRAALARIEHGLAEIDERRGAAGPARARERRPRPRRPATRTPPTLRGPAIREAAVRALVERGGDALHYREWFELLTATGHEIAGKDPLAVFLTQLSRSPALRKGARAGVYELDRQAAARLRATLDALQRELRELTAATHVDLADDPRAAHAAHRRDRPHRARARRGRARARPQPSRGRLSDATTWRPTIDVRPAEPHDAEAVAAIYNHGIEERQATFETRARRPNEIAGWLEEGRPFLVAVDDDARSSASPASRAYSIRRAYAGVGEHGVYVDPPRADAASACRLLDALADAAEDAGYYKLTSRVFTTNHASLALHRAAGFTEVGVQRRHGRLDGEWKDTILVERLLGDAAR